LIKNYLTIALRNIIRHKGNSAINIVGLAVGMACCVLISLFVWSELTYDACYEGSERIYRICTHKLSSGQELFFAGTSAMVTPILKERFPEVEAIAYYLRGEGSSVVRRGNMAFMEQRIMQTQTDIFKVLGTRFIAGNPETALDRPGTAVLTSSMAEKYFGDEDPLGQTLQIDAAMYEITGVTEVLPENTHLKIDILCTSETSAAEQEPWMTSWINSVMLTYVRLRPGVVAADFEEQIAGLAHEYGAEQLAERGETIRYFLQPIEEVHLGPQFRWEAEAGGNPLHVYGLATVGLLILLIATANFMNLSTARSAGRAAEVGVRKVAGARRGQLFAQFMGESALLVGIAVVAALLLVELALPQFNEIAGTAFTAGSLLQLPVMVVLLLSIAIVGLLAASYPALFLSRFDPVRVLKSGVAIGTRRSALRKTLVVGQFAICAALLIGIITVEGQLEHMKNRSLGFEKDRRLVIEMPRTRFSYDNRDSFKSEFLRNPAIVGATYSTSVPGRDNYKWITCLAGREQETSRRVNWYIADTDFIDEFGLEIVAGRGPRPGDSPNENWINEAAVAAFGWTSADEALGQHLNQETRTIVGVVRNFHYRGLQSEIEPFALGIGDLGGYMTLRLGTTDYRETVAGVRATFKELFPDGVFQYFFLDADFDRQYRSEDRLAGVLSVFTSLGILVACFGLFALAAFMAERRTKEVGIRKVLGASVPGLASLLTREFMVLVLVANLIAWPLAYLALDRWLQGFAYRITIGWGVFVVSGVLTLLIAMTAAGYQAFRAARANPVEALRYE